MKGLKREELVRLILAVRDGDNDALNTLIAEYRPLLLSVSNRYPSLNEYYCEACIGLYRAAMSFDVSQEDVTFGLYAAIVIRRRLRDLHKENEKESARLVDGDIDNIAVGDGILNRLLLEEEREEFRREMGELLSELECDVLMLSLEGLKTAEIADELSVSAKTVDNAKARVLKKLRAWRAPK